MDELSKFSNLRNALRRARVESAEQSEAQADLRQGEVARLELLEDAIRPIVDQTPDDVELFDLGVTQGDKPRLFVDMISFVDLAHDRRTFRFFQDTRHGRVMIAESDSADRIVAAVTNYVARRLVEREQALAADWRSRSPAAAAIRTRVRADHLKKEANGEAPPPAATPPEARPSVLGLLGAAYHFIAVMLGTIVLVVGLYFGMQAGWNLWGRPFWEAHFGAAPF